jgi:NAD(P)H-flavin reductase
VTAHAALVLTRASASPGLLSPAGPARIGAATAGVAAALVGAAALLGRRSSQAFRSGHRLARRLHVVLAATVTGGMLLHLLWSSIAVGDAATRDAVILTAGLLMLVVAGRVIVAGVAGRPAFVVEGVRTEREGVRTLVLRGLGRWHRTDLRAGQVLGLHLDTRAGERLPGTLRITSVANEPGRIEIALDAEDGALTSRVQLWPGRRVFAEGAHDPTTDGHQGSLLLVADHSEVPLALGLLRMQAERRDRRPHCLLVAGRERSDLTLRRELAEVGGRLDLDVVEVLAQPPLTWTGRRGRVDAALLREVLGQYRSLRAPHAYVFGPTSMTGEVRTALCGLGLAERRIHVDRIVHAT